MRPHITAFFLGAILFSNESGAQYATSKTSTSTVKFSTNHPSVIEIISPKEYSDENGKRGFKDFKIIDGKVTVIGKVEDEDGINMFLINNNPVDILDNGYFRTSLPLNDNSDAIDFIVIDTKNVTVTKSINLKGDHIFISGEYYALLIGVNEYQDPNVVDLDKPIADAKRLGKVLEEHYAFDKQNIKYLENPTRSEIINAIDDLSRKLTRSDNLLLFYAGHGYWDPDRELGFWIPSDGKKNSTSDWYRNTTLTEQLRTIKTQHTLLIADACFSGSIFKERAFSISEDAIGIRKLYQLPSRKAMTSGTMTTVPDKSLFLKFLTERLEENKEKYLPASDLFNNFRIAVMNNSDTTPQYGTIQKAGDEGGDFIFIRKE